MKLNERILRTATVMFRVDLRMLAVLRIGLAIIILWDMMTRIPWIEAFYSDNSFFTRAISKSVTDPSAWSLYWISGSSAFAILLFVLTAVAAVCLLFGFRTRLASVACLVLCYSLFVRMPLSLDGGHVLLRMLLFWSVFLPMGARFSIDARINDGHNNQDSISNIASAALMLQIAMMYFFSGLAKCNADWWNGNAIYQAMSLEMYVWPLAGYVRNQPDWLLQIAARGIVLAEIFGPVLLFLPGVFRITRPTFMTIFWSMHIGIWLTMSIGIFGAIAMLGWIVFLRWPNRKGNRATAASLDSKPRHRNSSWYYAGQICCGLFLVYVILFNVSNIDHHLARYVLPQGLKSIGWLTMTAQEFRMFGRPPEYSPDLYFEVLDPHQPLDKRHRKKPLPISSSHLTRRLNYNLIHFYDADEKTITLIREAWGEYLFTRWESAEKEPAFNYELNCTLNPIKERIAARAPIQQKWWKKDAVQ